MFDFVPSLMIIMRVDAVMWTEPHVVLRSGLADIQTTQASTFMSKLAVICIVH